MEDCKKMIIGIASPLSPKYLSKYLYKEDATIAQNLSDKDGPAISILSKELLEMGYKIVLFTLDSSTSKYLVLKGENITIYVAPNSVKGKAKLLYDVAYGRKRRLAKLYKMSHEYIDILNIHWTREYALAAIKCFKDTPKVVVFRDIIPIIMKLRHNRIGETFIYAMFYWQNEIVVHDKQFSFIANSIYTAEMAKLYWGMDIPSINNPVSNAFLNKITETHRYDNFTIVSISAAAPDDKRKNTLNLIKAFQQFKKKHIESQLILIGQKFTPQNNIIKKWNDMGLLDGVILKGVVYHDDLPSILCKCHVLVSPSLEESFGNTLIEAMACKCPVIGGENSGAVPYVLGFGEYGLLCNVESVRDIANKIEQVYNNDINIQNIIIKGVSNIKNNYTPRVIAEKYIQIFQKYVKQEHI